MVRVDEVVLVYKKFDMFGAGVGAEKDHEVLVLVSTCRLCGDFATEVAVDIYLQGWNRWCL